MERSVADQEHKTWHDWPCKLFLKLSKGTKTADPWRAPGEREESNKGCTSFAVFSV
jgi:hypothetical protein